LHFWGTNTNDLILKTWRLYIFDVRFRTNTGGTQEARINDPFTPTVLDPQPLQPKVTLNFYGYEIPPLPVITIKGKIVRDPPPAIVEAPPVFEDFSNIAKDRGASPPAIPPAGEKGVRFTVRPSSVAGFRGYTKLTFGGTDTSAWRLRRSYRLHTDGSPVQPEGSLPEDIFLVDGDTTGQLVETTTLWMKIPLGTPEGTQFELQLEALNGGGLKQSQKRWIVIDVGPEDTKPYCNWLISMRTPPRQMERWLPESLSAPTMDPDMDTLPNFMEFAFHRDPMIADAIMPYEATLKPDGNVEFNFRRYLDLQNSSSSVTFTPEVSTDLKIWNTIATIESSDIDNNDVSVNPAYTLSDLSNVGTDPGGAASFTPVKITTKVPPVAGKLFYRLRVRLNIGVFGPTTCRLPTSP
jgi:hypothetical protein